MSSKTKVHCSDCVYFRSAPYEARVDGCYFPGNMKSKQSARYLDEQQEAGDHERINRNGDCPDFSARVKRLPFWQRMLGLGA